MLAHLRTCDGARCFFSFWFFRGIFPRPKLSGRIFLILFFWVLLGYGFWFFVGREIGVVLTAVIWERVSFLLVGLSVLLSGIPVYFERKRLFWKAKKIIGSSENVEIIGITGSYGKSSTKEILAHLLRSKFGEDALLVTPENHNNEVAIARLVVKNKEWFKFKRLEPAGEPAEVGEGSSPKDLNQHCQHGLNQHELLTGRGQEPPSCFSELDPAISERKFFVVEIGAYAPGEIKTVCDFVRPSVGIITGVNSQHVSLFGSQDRLSRAKFELAEAAREKVLFNADSPLLSAVFEDAKIEAAPVAISVSVAKNLVDSLDKTSFSVYGEKMVLPLAGKFFVGNCLLAMECAREFGVSAKEICSFLPLLPRLDRALTVEKLPFGAAIIKDLYSANPDGVLAAIDYLGQFSGKKIFVGVPLLELGGDARRVHVEIFEALAKMEADVFWMKSDFEELGREICGERFWGGDLGKLRSVVEGIGERDAVLLESRLGDDVLGVFEHDA